MSTHPAEFPIDALAALVRESCDAFFTDDTVLTDWVVTEFTKRLEEALDGKKLVEVEGDDEPCEHEEYGPVVIMVERPMFTAIACLKCGEREAAGEGAG